MIRVTRYNENGHVFHTCLTPTVEEVYTNEHGVIGIDMPMRYWTVTEGGALELVAAPEKESAKL